MHESFATVTEGSTSPYLRVQTILSQRIPYLDALRAIAIVLVIFANVGLTGQREYNFLALKLVGIVGNAGWTGVQLFFVLSGFLITGILIDTRNSSHRLRNFYARRFLRIFPLYYSALIVCFIVLPLSNAVPTWLVDDQHAQLWYWLYVVNWAVPFSGLHLGLEHFWSLAVEEQFYLLWPLAVLHLRERKLIALCVFLVVAATCLRAMLIAAHTPLTYSLAYHATCARWDALAIGALVAIAMRNQTGFDWLHCRAHYWLGTVGGLVVLIVLIKHGFSSVDDALLGLNQTIASIGFGLLIFALVAQSASGRPLLKLDNALLNAIGKRSYAIYIFELPVSHIWRNTAGIDIASLAGYPVFFAICYNMVMVFLISCVLAIISWRYLESPALHLNRYFPRRDSS